MLDGQNVRYEERPYSKNRSQKAAAQVTRTLHQGLSSSVCQQEHANCILRCNNFFPFFVVINPCPTNVENMVSS